MYLSRLTLTNIRQFDQRTFDFQPGFNLLVGENGAGKTTILRGLIAALGRTGQMGRRPRLEDSDIRLRASQAEVEGTIRTANGHAENFYFRKALWERAKRSSSRKDLPLVLLYASNEATCSAMKVKRSKQTPNIRGDQFRRSEEFLYASEMEISQGRKQGNERLFGNSRSVREFVGQVLSTFSPEMSTFYWRFEPYDCLLLPAEVDGEKFPLDAKTREQAQAFAMRLFQGDWGRWRRRPFSWPDQAKVVLMPESSYGKSDDIDLPEVSEIWRDMKLSSEARERLLRCSLEVRLTPRIMIERKIGPLNLSQLSDGEQRLFSLFVDIARQLSNQVGTDSFDGGEAIVLIDEIDVHLHPRWQRLVVPALEQLFPNCQFIATTHSPFVIQATSRQRITSIDSKVAVSFVEGGNSIEDIAENIQGVPVPQRSVRAERLSDAAKKYFILLKRQDAKVTPVAPTELLAAEKSYREATEPFTSDPAVHAFLTVQVMEAKIDEANH